MTLAEITEALAQHVQRSRYEAEISRPGGARSAFRVYIKTAFKSGRGGINHGYVEVTPAGLVHHLEKEGTKSDQHLVWSTVKRFEDGLVERHVSTPRDEGGYGPWQEEGVVPPELGVLRRSRKLLGDHAETYEYRASEGMVECPAVRRRRDGKDFVVITLPDQQQVMLGEDGEVSAHPQPRPRAQPPAEQRLAEVQAELAETKRQLAEAHATLRGFAQALADGRLTVEAVVSALQTAGYH